jgi:hypothetical protein
MSNLLLLSLPQIPQLKAHANRWYNNQQKGDCPMDRFAVGIMVVCLLFTIPVAYEFIAEMVFDRRVFRLADRIVNRMPYSEAVQIAYGRVKYGRG